MTERHRFVPLFVPLLFGSMALVNVLTKPRFATYYGPDVVTLIAVGMCFGAALVMFFTMMKERRSQ